MSSAIPNTPAQRRDAMAVSSRLHNSFALLVDAATKEFGSDKPRLVQRSRVPKRIPPARLLKLGRLNILAFVTVHYVTRCIVLFPLAIALSSGSWPSHCGIAA